MIETLTIVDPAAVPVRAFNKSPHLSSGRTFHFKPGLNIVWGRNGVGKSMLLRLIASVFHCEQSGEPVYTHHSLNDLGLHKSRAERDAIARSFQMVHDGQTVYALDPEKAVGIVGGNFDDDFFGMGIRNTLFKGSSGQTTLLRADRFFTRMIAGEFEEHISESIASKRIDPDRRAYIESFLEPKIEKGQRTLLLDEPERALDILAQVNTWGLLRAYADAYQLFVASNSLVAIDIPEANYIEIANDGYLEKARDYALLLQGDKTWRNKKFEKPDASEFKGKIKKDDLF